MEKGFLIHRRLGELDELHEFANDDGKQLGLIEAFGAQQDFSSALADAFVLSRRPLLFFRSFALVGEAG
jgi:hypothetical protein